VISRHLELKIPPVLVTLFFALFIWLVSLWLPGIFVPEQPKLIITVVLTSLGALIAVSGVVSFRLSRTTLNPTRPDASSLLVTTGIYKFTRNPMYLGLLFLLAAWSVSLSSMYGLVLCLVFVFYMNRFQIKPEERVLQSFFGAAFSEYKARARRWL